MTKRVVITVHGTADDKNPVRPGMYHTTIIPRGLVYAVMQDLHHQQYQQWCRRVAVTQAPPSWQSL